MTRIIFVLLTLISFLAGSCTGRKNSVKHQGLIPEKELISLIADLYLADGFTTVPAVRLRYQTLDSLTIYYKIIEDHGYTKEVMDKTLKYYFIKDPKKLIGIYDHALGILSEMESRYELESTREYLRNSNLWTGKEFYAYPGTSDQDSTRFDVRLGRRGQYTLTFTATLFPDDQTLNPAMSAYLFNANDPETEVKGAFKGLDYIKDGRPHAYAVVIKVIENKPHHLKGLLYNFDNSVEKWQKHAIFEDISLVLTTLAL